MKALKVLLKIIAVIALAAVFSVLVSTTAVSYFAVTALTKIPQEQPGVDHNLKELTRIGQTYIQELESFEQINQDLQKRKVPPICSTVCNGSSMDLEKFSNERQHYLHQFYQSQKAQALNDPQFRIKLEELSFIAKAFPKSVRTLLTESLESTEGKTPDHLKLTLHFESVMLSELAGFKNHWAQLKADNEKLDALRTIVKSCRAGTAKKTLIQECKEQFPN